MSIMTVTIPIIRLCIQVVEHEVLVVRYRISSFYTYYICITFYSRKTRICIYICDMRYKHPLNTFMNMFILLIIHIS